MKLGRDCAAVAACLLLLVMLLGMARLPSVDLLRPRQVSSLRSLTRAIHANASEGSARPGANTTHKDPDPPGLHGQNEADASSDFRDLKGDEDPFVPDPAVSTVNGRSESEATAPMYEQAVDPAQTGPCSRSPSHAHFASTNSTRQGNCSGASGPGPKCFLYLLQTASKVATAFHDELETADADLLCVTYRRRAPPCHFAQHTTWTSGRNTLWQLAKRMPRTYVYYIFLDDDVSCVEGSFREFEKALLAHRPAIAVPTLLIDRKADRRVQVQTTLNFDAIMNAFHTDVMFGGTVLPYFDLFDTGMIPGFKASWWVSQLLVVYEAQILYPRHIARVNTVRIKNLHHGHYPKGLNHGRHTKWFFHNVYSDQAYAQRRWRGLVPGPAGLILPGSDFRVPAPLRRRLFNYSTPFWARRHAVCRADPAVT
uniref:Uncharacterized protein n=1 Tax=Eutreptiella gymnastica TaxID=73025 RepID=A0A7S1IP68_9EUGL|mmetsp:Transcript_33352/g.59743  ORF Transcript_33352/g.59743 Transcript_33352/m.59743 type:complete len:425 (+) Transcript_33352:229-1503(+)